MEKGGEKRSLQWGIRVKKREKRVEKGEVEGINAELLVNFGRNVSEFAKKN